MSQPVGEEPITPARRAPFADNPTLGARGLRTQQRILDAALLVFGESGYERAMLDRIGQVAGCSRVSIYQYFSGKDDIFRHLAGQVARQLRASMEALGPVTPDADGLAALRAWVTRYDDIHARYEPVFRAFNAAAETDEQLVGGAVSTSARNVATFLSRLSATTFPPRQLEPIVLVLLGMVTRALDTTSILRTSAREAYPPERLRDAVAAVLHRTLFGLVPGVNDRPGVGDPPPVVRLGPSLTARFDRARALQAESTEPDRRALAAMLAVGGEVVARNAYRRTPVAAVVAAAGVSHGAFYRYFENIDDFVGVIAVMAMADVSTALADLPDVGSRASLRRWLRSYHAVHSEKGALIRVWVEASEDGLGSDRAAIFDWGRRRMARLLNHRDFGDRDFEALALLGMVEAFGAQLREQVDVDAALRVVERGFLGRDN